MRALLALLFTAASAASAQNLITNGTFDRDLSTWTTLPAGGSIVWDSRDAASLSASGSVRITPKADQTLYPADLSQRVTVEPSKQYTFSVSTYLAGTNQARVAIVIYWLTAAGNAAGEDTVLCLHDYLLGSGEITCPATPSRNAWHRFAQSVTAPSNARTAKVRITVYARGTFSAYFDNVDFTAHGSEAVAANFTWTPTSPTTGQVVQFTDTSTGGPTQWNWDFDGNGTTDSTLQHPTYVFTTGGSYNVKLTVANGSGSASATKPLAVQTGTCSVACSARAPWVAEVGTPVTYNGNASLTGSCPPPRYFWGGVGTNADGGGNVTTQPQIRGIHDQTGAHSWDFNVTTDNQAPRCTHTDTIAIARKARTAADVLDQTLVALGRGFLGTIQLALSLRAGGGRGRVGHVQLPDYQMLDQIDSGLTIIGFPEPDIGSAATIGALGVTDPSTFDLVVTDPQGQATSTTTQAAGTAYIEGEFLTDGTPIELVIIKAPKNGTYSIDVVPNPGATGNVTVLAITKDGASRTTRILADDVPLRARRVADQPTCTYALNQSGTNIPIAGGTSAVSITAPSACAWSVATEASWLTPSVRNGVGTSTITLHAGAATSSRTAHVTIGGQRYKVTQTGTARRRAVRSPSPPSPSRSVVKNGDFDTDLSGWQTPDPATSVRWEPEDANGSHHSGSVLFRRSGTSGYRVLLEQCINVNTAPLKYRVAAALKGSVAGNVAYIYLAHRIYDQPNCTGNVSLSAGFGNTDLPSQWRRYQTTLEWPAGGRSIKVFVQSNAYAATEFEAAADEILIELLP